MIDPSLLGGALTGRMNFRPGAAPAGAPLPPGRHGLSFAEGREAVHLAQLIARGLSNGRHQDHDERSSR